MNEDEKLKKLEKSLNFFKKEKHKAFLKVKRIIKTISFYDSEINLIKDEINDIKKVVKCKKEK